jgi:hypothetical protein
MGGSQQGREAVAQAPIQHIQHMRVVALLKHTKSLASCHQLNLEIQVTALIRKAKSTQKGAV